MKDMKSRLATLWAEFKSKETFKPIYKYVYEFVKETGVRNVEADLGISMMELLFKEWYGAHFMESNGGLIIKFLWGKYEAGEMKWIKRDEWNCIHDFIEETKGGDVSAFVVTEEMPWPVIIEQLVAYLKELQ